MATADPIDALTERVIGCAMEVHRRLGPGLLESIYRDCLVIELRFNGMRVEEEVRVPITYRGQRIRDHLRLDLLVEGILVIEVKAVERLHAVHLAQVISYLKMTGYPAGLLFNFNVISLRSGLRRLNHPDRFRAKTVSRPQGPETTPPAGS